MKHPLRNTGYVHEERQHERVFGATPFSEPRNTLRNWKQFLSPAERQSGAVIDAMDCVSFAKSHDLDAQVNWLITSHLLSQDALNALNALGFITPAGFHCSARFIAVVSGTTQQGNTFSAVANAPQTFGLLPEADLPSEPGSMTWAQYYAPVPQALLDKAKRIKQILSFPWQYVNTGDINGALLTAPVQIATAVGPGWNTQDPLQAFDGPPQHSTLIYDVDDAKKYLEIMDQYNPFFKEMVPTYPIPAAMQTVVTPLVYSVVNPPGQLTKNLVYGQTDPDVARMQALLVQDGEPTASLDPVGFYGEGTRKAVLAFQRKYSVASWWTLFFLQGKQVGPATRAKMNSIIINSRP